MNERIKELAQQAGEAVVTELFEEYMLTETDDGAELKVPSIFIATFAELIVKECASLFPAEYDTVEGKTTIGKTIKQHFGVK